MEELICFLRDVTCLLMAGFGIYFGAVSLGCLLPKERVREAKQQLHFAVLVPARNESSCIAGIVESFRRQDYPKELVDIYVIPNHCEDDTAARAAAAGATILSVSAQVRSKGQALQEAFDILLREESHDAFCIFDADNEVNTEFLVHMNRALQGTRVAKSRIFAKNAHESWVCACYETFFCNANLLLNAARERWGLSARVIGTGFAVRRDLMEELGGWKAVSLTEDVEFYAMLAARGERTAFVPQAITYDEEPLTFRESLTQRRRWMSGIMEVAAGENRELLRSVLNGRGGRLALDAWLQLSYTLLQAWLIPLFLIWACVLPQEMLHTLLSTSLSFYAVTLLLGGISLAAEGRLTRHTLRALPLYPLFVFSFLPLQTWSIIAPNRCWKPICHSGIRVSGVTGR